MPPASDATESPDRPTSPGRAFWLGLVAFLAANLLLGLTAAESFKVDDSDQLLFSQSLEVGYHEQPPLYSWLCWLSFQALGLNPFALHLLKTLILAGLAVSLVWVGRLVLGDGRRAALAAATTVLIPTFSWHALTYLTHSNLLFVACAATVAALCRVYRDGRPVDYALLGLCAALGMLSKYNYAMFAAALGLAALTVPGFRARLLDRRLLVSAAVAGLVLAPHVAWVADHWWRVAERLANKTGITPEPQTLSGVARGSAHLAQTVLIILTPLWLLLPLGLPQALKQAQRPRDLPGDANRLLGRFLLVALGMLLAMVVVGGTTKFHERWLQPFTLFVPLYFFGRLRGVEVPAVRLRRLAWLAWLTAGALTGVRAGSIAAADLDRSDWPLCGHFAEAAGRLRSELGDAITVVGVDSEISGNLRYWWPEARHVCCRLPLYAPPGAGEGRFVVVWNATATEQPHPGMAHWLAKELGLGIPAGAPVRVIELAPPPARKAIARLAYAVAEPLPPSAEPH
jgi:4-amino-4-deoxy-L-arabinose transferase-like glycosyltransferase